MFFAFFLIGVTLFELLRKKVNGFYDVLTGVNIYFAVYFGLAPLLFTFINLTYLFPLYALPKNILTFYNSNNSSSYEELLILSSYSFILIGFYFGDLLKSKKNNSSFKSLNVSQKKLFYVGVIFFVVSFISLVFHTINFGGVSNVISSAESVRAINSQSDEKFMILRLFQPFIIGSFFCFLILWKSNKKSLISLVLIINAVLLIYYLLISASRYQILAFIITLALFYIKQIKVKHFLVAAFLIFFGFIYGDALLNYLINGYSIEVSFFNKDSMFVHLSTFLHQTSFPYINTVMVDDFVNNFSNYRLFGDFFYPFVNLVPSALLGIIGMQKVPQIWSVNTTNFGSITSGVPVDIVSFGYYQLGFLGIIVTGLIFGYSLKKVNNVLNKYDGEVIKLLKIQSLFVVGSVVINADPEVFIRGNLNFILFFLIFVIFRSKNPIT